MSNFPLILFTFRAFVSYLEQFLFCIVFQTVHKPPFLNRTVPLTRIGGYGFNTFHWQAPLGIYAPLCEALVFYYSLASLNINQSAPYLVKTYTTIRAARAGQVVTMTVWCVCMCAFVHPHFYKVKVTLESQIFVRTITSTVLNGFQYKLAHHSPSWVDVPFETFVFNVLSAVIERVEMAAAYLFTFVTAFTPNKNTICPLKE